MAQHADDLSKVVGSQAWNLHAPKPTPPWVFDLVIHELASDRCVETSIRIPGLSNSLP